MSSEKKCFSFCEADDGACIENKKITSLTTEPKGEPSESQISEDINTQQKILHSVLRCLQEKIFFNLRSASNETNNFTSLTLETKELKDKQLYIQ